MTSPGSARPRASDATAFWSRSATDVLRELDSTPNGLDGAGVTRRRERYGTNAPRMRVRRPWLDPIMTQLRSPIAMLLVVAAVLSAIVGEAVEASVILLILLASGGLGVWQERRAADVVEGLLGMIRTTTRVRRGGAEVEIPVEDVVPGDVVVLGAGDLVPADCRILEARDLDVDESVLTGESYPASKHPDEVEPSAPPSKRSSALFQGTHVVSGTAVALVVATGEATVYGALAGDLERRRPESEFERGVRRFGYLLLEVTAVLVVVVFAINVAFERPVLDVLLFTLALAVGLTPQLLPAIVSVTLSQGAQRMASRGVVARRLVAIENFGGMQVLCTDKTGTLTEGRVRIAAALDVNGQPSGRVLRLARLNASLQSGYRNPLDEALRGEGPEASDSGVSKLDEVPYDFSRRRLSVLLREADGSPVLVTKGAVDEVLGVCTSAEGSADPAGNWRAEITRLVRSEGQRGRRCVAVASARMPGAMHATRADEREMTLAGILVAEDPPKDDAAASLERLRSLGIRVKMITGDRREVAGAVAATVGLDGTEPVTGAQVARLGDVALQRLATRADVFAEVDPNQKARIISALRRTGVSVGYLGDGINDAGALHAADIGISVDTAVDATHRAADIVLLRKDLTVLADGVAEGRRAFANTLKYVFVTTSASFGNMLSMAGASLMTAFLPMLPQQILLLNLLSDLPAMAVATDRLDPELVARPRRWDVRFIRDFMFTFGVISSVFDFLTFGLLVLLAVEPAVFRTGWFLESVLTEIFVLLVIRTSRTFFRSLPSRTLLAATLGVAAISLVLPFLPGAGLLGFAPLPPGVVAALLALTLLLLIASETAKTRFFRTHPLGGVARSAS
ncbi:MAG: magnesium-translocating P-type ATPase [Gemmatimonadales bacterium]